MGSMLQVDMQKQPTAMNNDSQMKKPKNNWVRIIAFQGVLVILGAIIFKSLAIAIIGVLFPFLGTAALGPKPTVLQVLALTGVVILCFWAASIPLP